MVLGYGSERVYGKGYGALNVVLYVYWLLDSGRSLVYCTSLLVAHQGMLQSRNQVFSSVIYQSIEFFMLIPNPKR